MNVKGISRQCNLCSKVVVNIYDHLKLYHKLEGKKYNDVLNECQKCDTTPVRYPAGIRYRCHVGQCSSVVMDRRKHLRTHKNISTDEIGISMKLFEVFDDSQSYPLENLSPGTKYGKRKFNSGQAEAVKKGNDADLDEDEMKTRNVDFTNYTLVQVGNVVKVYEKWMKDIFEGKVKDDANAAKEANVLLRTLNGIP